MRAVLIERQGAPVASNITARTDWKPPEEALLGPGQVRIRVEASALNHMDIWVGLGIPGVNLTYPRVSGCDSCGIVEEIGPEVPGAWLGRRVIVNAAVAQPNRPSPDEPSSATLAPDYQLIGEHTHGMHRETFLCPAANLAPIGQDADPIEAASFGLTFLTAYSMIVGKAGLRPGQSVLITGIGGGVALAALSIAKWMACPVCVTSRHQSKLDQALALGADHALLDQDQDWSSQVRAWTDKRGVDLAVDSVGNPTHLKCIKSLARGGAYLTPGATGGPRAETDIARIFWNQLRILGSTMGTNDELRELASLFRAGRLRPVVDRVFPWQNAAAAWARLEAAQQFGKVVLDWR